jgi:hypothetical protein
VLGRSALTQKPRLFGLPRALATVRLSEGAANQGNVAPFSSAPASQSLNESRWIAPRGSR